MFKKMLAALRLRYPALYQLAGFCIVGASGLLVNLAAYYAVLAGGAGIQIANAAGFVASTAYAYLMNFVFVFQARGVSRTAAAMRFFTLYFVLYLASIWLVHFFADVAGISRLVVPILTSIIITGPSFLGSKYWVFPEKETRKSPRRP